ncbi:lysozyme [Variovorax sp. RCC_210]|uniref:lysozyme n=1 Tax=Variovorax sp. RCC_210 TaxID=3239217 RepID=UPI0035263C38
MAGPNRNIVATVVVAGATLVAGSPFLMSFLQKWESGKARVLVVYADKLAGDLPTVCDGLTRHVTTTPIIVGEVWSNEKCEAEEAAAVIRVQAQLAPCFKVAPPQVVFDMATSHAWNVGASSTCSSGAMAAFNRGDFERGCQRLSRGDDGRVVWSFTSKWVGGKKVLVFRQGLANRRADETKTCLEGWS